MLVSFIVEQCYQNMIVEVKELQMHVCTYYYTYYNQIRTTFHPVVMVMVMVMVMKMKWVKDE
jgi:hypothetical protein